MNDSAIASVSSRGGASTEAAVGSGAMSEAAVRRASQARSSAVDGSNDLADGAGVVG